MEINENNRNRGRNSAMLYRCSLSTAMSKLIYQKHNFAINYENDSDGYKNQNSLINISTVGAKLPINI